ncbi:MAG TPA: type II toxin-antitoxin system VapC family toxin [Anaerolineales bacterium]|nr:type II toxin-antitoxin system VapC family toxin [Anaerolineales bacterium]
MASNAAAYVLDSFAVLAYFEGEPGMARVRTLLSEATKGLLALHLSIINLGEILYTVEREQGLVAAQRALAALDQLPVQVHPADRGVVLLAARVKARYRISYADAFAVVVAQEKQAVLLTGDPEFKPLETDRMLKVEWLSRR